MKRRAFAGYGIEHQQVRFNMRFDTKQLFWHVTNCLCGSPTQNYCVMALQKEHQSCQEKLTISVFLFAIFFFNLQVQDIARITGNYKLVKLWSWISRIFFLNIRFFLCNEERSHLKSGISDVHLTNISWWHEALSTYTTWFFHKQLTLLNKNP